MINYKSWCTIRTEYGPFRLYENDILFESCYLLSYGDISVIPENPLIRIQSSCITSEVFKSLDCDCNDQLDLALKKIQLEKFGLLFYLLQEGRGQGIENKIQAMKLMEEKNIDTFEAYSFLKLEQDIRDYSTVILILKQLGIKKIRLLTNNPNKVFQISNGGVEVERIEHIPALRDEFVDYLKSKRDKLHHIINL